MKSAKCVNYSMVYVLTSFSWLVQICKGNGKKWVVVFIYAKTFIENNSYGKCLCSKNSNTEQNLSSDYYW